MAKENTLSTEEILKIIKSSYSKLENDLMEIISKRLNHIENNVQVDLAIEYDQEIKNFVNDAKKKLAKTVLVISFFTILSIIIIVVSLEIYQKHLLYKQVDHIQRLLNIVQTNVELEDGKLTLISQKFEKKNKKIAKNLAILANESQDINSLIYFLENKLNKIDKQLSKLDENAFIDLYEFINFIDKDNKKKINSLNTKFNNFTNESTLNTNNLYNQISYLEQKMSKIQNLNKEQDKDIFLNKFFIEFIKTDIKNIFSKIKVLNNTVNEHYIALKSSVKKAIKNKKKIKKISKSVKHSIKSVKKQIRRKKHYHKKKKDHVIVTFYDKNGNIIK